MTSLESGAFGQDESDALEPTLLPEGFITQVKQVLEHLYDFPYLEHHALAIDRQAAPHSTEAAGQQLRRELIAAIESLSPGPGVPFRSPGGRLYNVLHLHYVEGMTIQETARELFISMRQAYRDLRRGEESVATVLWTRSETPASPSGASLASSLQTEMARLETHPRPIDVRRLLEHALKAVERLASQRGVAIQMEGPSEPAMVSTDPVVAQQVLVNALSYAVQQSRPGVLAIGLAVDAGRVSCHVRYPVDPGAVHAPAIDAVVAQLAELLEWRVVQQDLTEADRTITLDVNSLGRTLLVIDDNEGLAHLIERYLAGHACRVVAATTAQEGLQMAEDLSPHGIILDVMMPGMDGWELLQILRTRQQTANIPVIICSVFNDPELAYSLGASLLLPKPIGREAVLNALRQFGVI